MLKTYHTGGDIHALTTAVIYKIPLEEASDKNHPQYKERRTIAKNCNFGTFFGLFPKGLQKTLKFKGGLDVYRADCETIIRIFKMGYHWLQRRQDEIKKEQDSANISKHGSVGGVIFRISHPPTGTRRPSPSQINLCRECGTFLDPHPDAPPRKFAVINAVSIGGAGIENPIILLTVPVAARSFSTMGKRT